MRGSSGRFRATGRENERVLMRSRSASDRRPSRRRAFDTKGEMLVITGAGGFIGSALAAALNEEGRADPVIVDRFGWVDKWRNGATSPSATSSRSCRSRSRRLLGRFGDQVTSGAFGSAFLARFARV